MKKKIKKKNGTMTLQELVFGHYNGRQNSININLKSRTWEK